MSYCFSFRLWDQNCNLKLELYLNIVALMLLVLFILVKLYINKAGSDHPAGVSPPPPSWIVPLSHFSRQQSSFGDSPPWKMEQLFPHLVLCYQEIRKWRWGSLERALLLWAAVIFPGTGRLSTWGIIPSLQGQKKQLEAVTLVEWSPDGTRMSV